MHEEVRLSLGKGPPDHQAGPEHEREPVLLHLCLSVSFRLGPRPPGPSLLCVATTVPAAGFPAGWECVSQACTLCDHYPCQPSGFPQLPSVTMLIVNQASRRRLLSLIAGCLCSENCPRAPQPRVWFLLRGSCLLPWQSRHLESPWAQLRPGVGWSEPGWNRLPAARSVVTIAAAGPAQGRPRPGPLPSGAGLRRQGPKRLQAGPSLDPDLDLH